MTLWIVTVKLPKNPKHNPTNKLTSTCPVNHTTCTDTTGQHHSFLYYAENNVPAELVYKHFVEKYHVTRIEEANCGSML